MARIDINQLSQQATVMGWRVMEVQQDPAVQKACKLAALDVATAARSVGSAVVEIRTAWRRSAAIGAGSSRLRFA